MRKGIEKEEKEEGKEEDQREKISPKRKQTTKTNENTNRTENAHLHHFEPAIAVGGECDLLINLDVHTVVIWEHRMKDERVVAITRKNKRSEGGAKVKKTKQIEKKTKQHSR